MLIIKILKYRISLALAMMSLLASQATRCNGDFNIDAQDSFVLSGGLGSDLQAIISLPARTLARCGSK